MSKTTKSSAGKLPETQSPIVVHLPLTRSNKRLNQSDENSPVSTPSTSTGIVSRQTCEKRFRQQAKTTGTSSSASVINEPDLVTSTAAANSSSTTTLTKNPPYVTFRTPLTSNTPSSEASASNSINPKPTTSGGSSSTAPSSPAPAHSPTVPTDQNSDSDSDSDSDDELDTDVEVDNRMDMIKKRSNLKIKKPRAEEILAASDFFNNLSHDE